MAKSRNTRNRTNKNTETSSAQRERANAAIDGRAGRYSSYTGGGRTARAFKRYGLYNMSEGEGMREAWQNRANVPTYTSTPSGLMSINGRNTRGAVTNALTPKNDDGSPVINERTGEARKSGREKLATRRQRDYDNRKAMNNITPRLMQAWIRQGWVREVDGNYVGNGRIIRQKPDGNYSMGLATG